MVKMGTVTFFKDRMEQYDSTLSRKELTKRTFTIALRNFFQSIWRALVECFRPGRFTKSLQARVTDLKQDFKKDAFLQTIRDYTREEPEFAEFLPLWKEKIRAQHAALAKKLDGLDTKKLKNYGFIDALIKRVKAYHEVQKQECSLEQLNLSFFYFVDEKIKALCTEKKAKIQKCIEEHIEECEHEESKAVVHATLRQLFSPLVQELTDIQRENEQWEPEELEGEFTLAVERMENVQQLAHRIEYALRRAEFEKPLALANHGYELLFDQFEKGAITTATLKKTEEAIEKCRQKYKALLDELDQFNQKMTGWIVEANLGPELSNEFIEDLETVFLKHQHQIEENGLGLSMLNASLEDARARAKDEEYIRGIEAQGFKRVPVKPDGHCLFAATLEGLKELHKDSEEWQKLTVLEFRQKVYAYMQAHKEVFDQDVQIRLTQDMVGMEDKSDEAFATLLERLPPKLHLDFIYLRSLKQKYGPAKALLAAAPHNINTDAIEKMSLEDFRREKSKVDPQLSDAYIALRAPRRIEKWLTENAFDLYVNSMATCSAFGEEIEMAAISQMERVVIRTFSNLYNRPIDIKNFPEEEKEKATIHLVRPKQDPHFDYMRVKPIQLPAPEPEAPKQPEPPAKQASK